MFLSPNSQFRSIPPLLNDSDILYDNEEKADAFNNYFTQQTFLIEPDREPTTPVYIYSTTFSSLHLEQSEIKPLLQSLPLGKAVGPDLINNRVLKETPSQLAVPLSEIFNYSLSIGVFSTQWKIANVCPVHKKNDTNVVSNYRPISLLCSLSKVFEKAVYKHTYNHLINNNILTEF